MCASWAAVPIEKRTHSRWLPALAALPMLGAALGAWLDERRLLGFSTWRSACRAAGLDFSSLLSFTWQLLPLTLAGLLSGGAVVLAIAIVLRGEVNDARLCLAAHAGCALALPVMLLLCASTLPWVWMLIADVVITTAAAWLLLGLMRTVSQPRPAHP
jgi:hypothetical protein